jgi:uncharacterized protein YcnI
VRRWMSIVMVALGVTAAVVGGSTAAWAHDLVTPAYVVAGSKATVTVLVVNEHELPTDGLEMRLPAGFVLTAAQDVPGWRTDVQRQADGTASAVRWTGGLVNRNASAEFVVTGNAPPTAGSLIWAVAQKSVGSKTYIAPPVDVTPFMTVTTSALPNGTASTKAVPLAASSRPATTPPVDAVARSRATLAMVLAGLALLGVVAFGSATVGRAQLTAHGEAEVASPVEPTRPGPAKTSGKRNRQQPVSAGTGDRR